MPDPRDPSPSRHAPAPAPAAPAAPLDDDAALLRRFVRGSRPALESLALRHEPALLGLATGLLNGRADLAADAVQDAWLRVIRAAPHFDARSSVRTWLYRIVVNRCYDLRAAAARAPLDPASRAPSPNTPHADLDALEPLRAAVERLPTDHRLILLLCYHAGTTHTQAADILGIPVGTLKSRLSSALSALRAALPPEATP